MPAVSFPLPDTYQTITRPSISQITDEVIKILDMGDITVKYSGDIKAFAPVKNTIDKKVNDTPTLSTLRMLKVSVTEDYATDYLASTATHELEHNPIFLDSDIDVYIRPIYIMTDFIIDYEYETSSYSEAVRWRDDIRSRISRLRDINLHSIIYDIMIPKSIEEFVNTLYEYRIRLEPNLDFVDYYLSHMPKNYNVMTDFKGENSYLTIREKQTRIVGRFDFSPIPEKIEKNQDDNNYSIRFGYKISFEKPSLLAVNYPVMVYNRMLPFKYLEHLDHRTNQPKDEIYHDLRASRSIRALSNFEFRRQVDFHKNVHHVIALPQIDDYHSYKVHPGYTPIYTALCEINEQDKVSLFNFETDIDPYMIDPDILQFIRESELPYINKPYQSFFYIGLHGGKRYNDAPFLTMDHTLNIKSIKSLDLTKIHHVIFSLCTDITMLREPAINRLKKYPIVLEKVMLAINEKLRDDVNAMLALGKNKIDVKDIIYRYLRYGTGMNRDEILKNTVQINTVQISSIIALRTEN